VSEGAHRHYANPRGQAMLEPIEGVNAMVFPLHSIYPAHVGDRVEVLNLDGSIAYRGVVIRVDRAVTVRAYGSREAIAEHPASVRLVVEPAWL
jgi:hypothetical protein